MDGSLLSLLFDHRRSSSSFIELRLRLNSPPGSSTYFGNMGVRHHTRRARGVAFRFDPLDSEVADAICGV